jgi:L-lactate dehydrogenase
MRAGLADDRAAVVADILVEGELFGHDTHGLALLKPYVDELLAGAMATTGEPVSLSDRGAAIVWDGCRLPGPYLVTKAVALATQRAALHGTATLVIRRSHHTAALAAYLEPPTRQGMMVVLASSDPNTALVAPFGGTRAVFTPNPIAAAWPTPDGPVLLDISTSVTSAGLVGRRRREGRRLPGPWLLDAAGQPTDDPDMTLGGDGGSIQSLGGADAGHKGYALALMVEAWTSGLAGFGRADPPAGAWGAAVFVQVMDPAAFGGAPDFLRETGHLAALCRASPPADPARPVRLPGAGALARKAKALASGLALREDIRQQLADIATTFALAMPAPRAP